MGSLTSFAPVISERTGIPVRSIDMVSTATVIETVRKSNILDMELDSIYDSLKDFRGYGGYNSDDDTLDSNQNHTPSLPFARLAKVLQKNYNCLSKIF